MKSILFASLLLVWNPSHFTQDAATDIDACSLLTRAEVEKAIETPVLQPESEASKLGDVPVSRCTFKKSADQIDVVLTVYTYQSKNDAQESFERSRQRAEDSEPVKGLGDGAYWWKSTATLFVMKGSHVMSIL